MQQHILHISGEINQDALAVLCEHGAIAIEHSRSLEIQLPIGTLLANTVQEEDSLPEAGISAKEETRYYIFPDRLPVIYRRGMESTPRSFRTYYEIGVNMRALSLMII